MSCHRDPAVVIQRAIAEHLKVLSVAPLRGFGIVEAVHHADAFDWLLRHAVEFHWCGDVRRLQDGGHKIDHMVELPTYATRVLNSRRPRDDEGVARATKMRRNLLAPLEGRVHCPGPADREMIVGVGATDFVNVTDDIGSVLRDAVEARHLIEHAIERAFHGRAVVTDFPDVQRIVELSQVA